MSPKRCTYCGSRQLLYDEFCTKCGHRNTAFDFWMARWGRLIAWTLILGLASIALGVLIGELAHGA